MATEYTEEERIQLDEIRGQRSFLGHPKATGTLSFMQLCNSFGNYGMSAILIYYMYLGISQGGLGFTQTEAAQLTSLYSAVSVLVGLIGSYVADRILGPRKALGIARTLQAFGYLCLVIPGLGVFGYAASQVILCMGTMISGRSLEAVMGGIYEAQDNRRDAAFTLAYVISNIGACAPAITGPISLALGYHVAFGFSAVLAGVGAVSYWATQAWFGPVGDRPTDPLPSGQKRKVVAGLAAAVVVLVAVFAYLFVSGSLTISVFANGVSTVAIFIPLVYLAYIILSKKSSKEESKHVLWLLPLFFCNAFTMVLYAQASSIVAVYTETSVDRVVFGTEIPAATWSTLGAIFAVLFGSLLSILWTKLGKHQPKAPTKLALGTAIYALAPLVMVIPLLVYPEGAKVSWIWIVLFWGIAMLGEAFVSPTGFALTTAVAPVAFTTQMVTVWNLAQSTGSGISTIVTNFYVEGNEAMYFLVLGGVFLVYALICFAFTKVIQRGMGMDVEAGK